MNNQNNTKMKTIKLIILASVLMLAGCSDPELVPHKEPVVTENGCRAEVITNGPVTVEQAKALITNIRSRSKEYKGTLKDGQVILRAPSGDVTTVIFNEIPDMNGENYIIYGK